MFVGSALGVVAGMAYTSCLAYACVSDLRTRRIPNRLVLVLALSGLLFCIFTDGLLAGVARGFGGLATGLAIWLPFWLLGWLGAGDVKLFAGGAAWLGPLGALGAAAIGALVGAGLTTGWLGWERGVRVALEKSLIAMIHPRVLTSRPVASAVTGRLVPYGIALAVGLGAAAWFPSLLPF